MFVLVSFFLPLVLLLSPARSLPRLVHLCLRGLALLGYHGLGSSLLCRFLCWRCLGLLLRRSFSGFARAWGTPLALLRLVSFLLFLVIRFLLTVGFSSSSLYGFLPVSHKLYQHNSKQQCAQFYNNTSLLTELHLLTLGKAQP